MSDHYEMSASIVRQRSNLFIVSLWLIFIIHSGVTINSVNIIGIHLSISKIQSVKHGLWIVWLYFLIRFYQHLKVDGKARLERAFGNSISAPHKIDHTLFKNRCNDAYKDT